MKRKDREREREKEREREREREGQERQSRDEIREQELAQRCAVSVHFLRPFLLIAAIMYTNVYTMIKSGLTLQGDTVYRQCRVARCRCADCADCPDVSTCARSRARRVFFAPRV